MNIQNELPKLLEELVKLRKKELANAHISFQDRPLAEQYAKRTADIEESMKSLNTSNLESCDTLLTIDDAINHCDEVISNTPESSCKKNHEQLKAWLEELKDTKIKFTYLQADFDNYKKRMLKWREDTISNSNKELLLKILDVVSDFDRVMTCITPELDVIDESENGKSTTLDPIKYGIQLTYENLVKTLNGFGCTKIETNLGDAFDANIHECIHAVNEPNAKTDEIVKIIRTGWMLNGKLLRPVQVITAL